MSILGQVIRIDTAGITIDTSVAVRVDHSQHAPSLIHAFSSGGVILTHRAGGSVRLDQLGGGATRIRVQ
jgi:hypothetical protein